MPHEDNKIAFLRQQVKKLSEQIETDLGSAEESYSNLAETASRLHEALLWAGWAAWDNHQLIQEVLYQVCTNNMSVAQALSSCGYEPMKSAVHVRYYFTDGKFFCEGCNRNVDIGCKDGCPMIPKLEIPHEPTDTTP